MIQINQLNFSYFKNKNPLLNNLMLDLEGGSITGLLGKNGAGKTTLIKLLCGLLYPQSGSIIVNQHQPNKRQPAFLSDVYFVPEEFDLPAVSIHQYISVYGSFYPGFDLNMMYRLLGDFQLDAKQRIHELSFGQKKKMIISFALATCCRFIIMDEPTNGLDIPSKATFRKVIAGALMENQLILISTHQVKDIENLIDRILVISEGELVLQKEIHDISDHLHFSTCKSASDKAILYSETAPGGFKVIQKRMNGASSIDLELLFNALDKGINLFQE